MPVNYHRTEVRFSRKNMEKLLDLQKDAKAMNGKFVSVSTLVDEIVSRFFKKEEVEEDVLHSPRK